MSYSRSSYTSPSGSHGYQRSNYVSPSGNSRYSSTSSYDSSKYSSGGLGGSKYGSGLLSNYGGGSLGNLSSSNYSSRYSDSSSPSKYGGSSYTPSSSSYTSKSGRYDSGGSSYTPRTDYSSRYSRPTSSYDSDYSSSTKTRSRDDYSGSTKSRSTDLGSASSRPARKARFADDEEYTPRATKKSSDTGSYTKASRSDDSLTTKARQRKRDTDEGSSPVPTRAVDADVSSLSRKTEGLSIDNSSQQRPYSPSFQEFGKQAADSARYQEQVTETPQYRPYTNPNLQSNSFKTLQTVINSGQDPGSYFQKAPWQSTTVNQVDNEPRKYTPSQTWAAVHSDGRNGSAVAPGPGAFPPRQAGAYQPPRADGYNPPQSVNQYAPPARNYFNTPKPFVPSGGPAKTAQAPSGDGVATKGTSAINQQGANPDKIPVCAKCDTEIRGPFVLALNKSWCPNHFTCSKCDSELVNMGFVELNGQVYCENDYESFFAPKCAKCRQAIVGDTVNALEKTWHPTCFVCEECGDAISSGAFHVEEGRPYCMKDWQRLFQTKCTGCSYPVEPGDKWIEALDANWHSECFVCGVCKIQLEGTPFYPRDGKPFCKDHVSA